MDKEEFSLAPLEGRIVIQEVEDYLEKNKDADVDTMLQYFLEHAKASNCNNVENIKMLFKDLYLFLNVQPQLPLSNKHFIELFLS